jgi:hypothetical protein
MGDVDKFELALGEEAVSSRVSKRWRITSTGGMEILYSGR